MTLEFADEDKNKIKMVMMMTMMMIVMIMVTGTVDKIAHLNKMLFIISLIYQTIQNMYNWIKLTRKCVFVPHGGIHVLRILEK